jgi:hypothetical protein
MDRRGPYCRSGGIPALLTSCNDGGLVSSRCDDPFRYGSRGASRDDRRQGLCDGLRAFQRPLLSRNPRIYGGPPHSSLPAQASTQERDSRGSASVGSTNRYLKSLRETLMAGTVRKRELRLHGTRGFVATTLATTDMQWPSRSWGRSGVSKRSQSGDKSESSQRWFDSTVSHAGESGRVLRQCGYPMVRSGWPNYTGMKRTESESEK